MQKLLASLITSRLSAAERAQFRSEQHCTIQFAGLPRVVRVFI